MTKLFGNRQIEVTFTREELFTLEIQLEMVVALLGKRRASARRIQPVIARIQKALDDDRDIAFTQSEDQPNEF
ncbi:MAG TPA: hypothetical protein V6C65_18880 [Allocoleopsis sp.]